MKYSRILYLLIVILLASCKTDKNTFVTRAYHNTTSHYNGYFNARELMRENVKSMRLRHMDDYSQKIPLFVYPSEKQSQDMYEDMDKVIEKCSQVIERHSIYLRRKEHVKWIDDSYFLIGKARFYKMEYGLAQEAFLYVYQGFKKTEERYNGLNWLIKSYIEDDEWEKAEEFLELGEASYNKYPAQYKGMFNAVYADFYLKKDKDIVKAIEKLEKAVVLTEDKFHLRRYTYLLAQLYQQQNELGTAMEKYLQVIKLRPDYTMRFNAKISRAIAYDVKGGNSAEIKKELNKMLKDAKNEEFRDQIYFALAEVAIKEKDESLAIDYLKKSAKVSQTNVKQKALAYLKLANIYFNQPNYVAAQTYYDSTLKFLPMEHPEYYEADTKNSSLQDLVKNLKEIDRLDSLLILSNLSKEDRKKRVESMIEDIKKEEERQKLAKLKEVERQQAALENSKTYGPTSGRGKWYFYNASTMASGKAEFKRIWGERPLADNWNRKSNSINMDQGSQGGVAQSSGEVPNDSVAAQKYDPEKYLAEIPSTYLEKLNAHGKLVEALFNAGTIFKESFNDDTNAINAFKRITTNYDTSSLNLPSHYQLYRIYLSEDETEKTEFEKKWVLDNHPFSEYAYLIKNPNYNKDSKETKEKIEEYYEATYKLYSYGLYTDVIESCQKAKDVFNNDYLQSKFDFLRTKSIGYTQDKETFKVALEKFIEEYPEDSLKENAIKILSFMNKVETNEPKESKAIYVHESSKPHMFILSFSKNESGSNELKNTISNFNDASFSNLKLEFTTTELNNNRVFLVRTFKNQSEAMRYYRAINNNKNVQSKVEKIESKSYVISVPNFRQLFQEKNEGEYLTFFFNNYPL